MTEGRKSQIILLDERRLDIIIQPRLYARELLDLVSSHFKLKEKEYFGLAFVDDTGHFNWLQLDKRVLEHDFPRRGGILVLHFSIRFYIETIGHLKDNSTVELFYLNAKQAVFRGQIECDSETVFELAAHVLQATNGDFYSEETAAADLKKLPVIPTNTLKEHPSITYCEERVIEFFKKLAGTSRGLAIVNYMTIVESLPTYGIHYYEVKDKKDIPWWLGISYKGIAVYDRTDKTTPRRIFTWKNLENLYYRDRKFSVEVHDPKRIVHALSSFNLYEDAIREPVEEFDELSDAISDPTTQVSVSRRTFGPGNVNAHVWFAVTPQLTKCIWSMAVGQHQFYLEKKQSKPNLRNVRSMSEIAADLGRSTSSLPGSLGSDLSRSSSSHSLPSLSASRFDLNIDAGDAVKAQREMMQALKARKEALEEALKKKTEELKLLCIKEGELTGFLPAETPIAPGEQPPQIRRRVGTAFTLSSKVVDNKNETEDALSKLELEYELQGKISKAAYKLAHDKSVSKYVRKQRRLSYNRATVKLKEMEKKLSEMREQAGKGSFQPLPGFHESVSPTASPHITRVHRDFQDDGTESVRSPTALHRSSSLTDTGQHGHHSSGYVQPMSSGQEQYQQHSNRNHVQNVQHANRSQDHPRSYPTYYDRSQSSISNHSEYENVKPSGCLEGSQDSGFCSTNNMYNVAQNRASRYDSLDELKSVSSSNVYDSTDDCRNEKLILPSKHGSLDGAYRKSSTQKYGSLERKQRHAAPPPSGFGMEDLTPSKYGSKRESQSDYSDYEGKDQYSRGSVIELHVSHEKNSPVTPQSDWRDSHYTAPSPMIQSPGQHSLSEQQSFSSYVPETSLNSDRTHFHTPESSYPSHNISYESQQNYESPQSMAQSSKLVTVTKLQPHTETCKPFEMSDFYKYSEKLRRQRMIEQYSQQLLGESFSSRASTPSCHSSDSSDNIHGMTSPHYPVNYSPTHSQYSGGRSSPYNTPVIQRANPVAQYTSHTMQKRDDSSPYTATQSSSSYQTVRGHGSHMHFIQSRSQVSYKGLHQNTKHSQYQAPQPMTCEPVREKHNSASSSGSSTINR